MLSAGTIVLGILSATRRPKTLFPLAALSVEPEQSLKFKGHTSSQGCSVASGLRSHRAVPCGISRSLAYSLLAGQKEKNGCNSFHSCRRACACHVTRTSGSHKATVPNKSAFSSIRTQKFKMTEFPMLTSNYLIDRKVQIKCLRHCVKCASRLPSSSDGGLFGQNSRSCPSAKQSLFNKQKKIELINVCGGLECSMPR